MTTIENREHTSRESWPMFATLGVGLALVLTAIATFWDITGNDNGSDAHATRDYLVTVGIIVVVAAVAFAVAAARPSVGLGLGLAIVAVLSNVAFWAGAPSVLAAAAVFCALAPTRESGRASGLTKATFGLAALAVLLNIVAVIVG